MLKNLRTCLQGIVPTSTDMRQRTWWRRGGSSTISVAKPRVQVCRLFSLWRRRFKTTHWARARWFQKRKRGLLVALLRRCVLLESYTSSASIFDVPCHGVSVGPSGVPLPRHTLGGSGTGGVLSNSGVHRVSEACSKRLHGTKGVGDTYLMVSIIVPQVICCFEI